MSCGIALTLALSLAALEVAPPANAPVAVASSPTVSGLVSEPLFADIISRASRLKLIVDGWSRDRAVDQAGFFAGADFVAFRSDVEQLASLDMQGHVVLRDRGNDDDLKCILRGISEDLPHKIEALQTAPDAAERAVALSELAYLLNDNVEVITAPPFKPEA